MKKTILATLLITSSLLSDINVPKALSDNDFETSEFQMFITNTKNIPITTDMTSKVIFEGGVKDYYKNYSEMNKKRFKAAEEIGKRITNANQALGNAAYYKDVKSLQNIGIASIGSIALNAVLGTFLADKTYVQVLDFYKDDKKITRVIKYLVSDDGLDKDEYELVFNTTNTDSYHFRSGAITNITKRIW